MVDDTDGGPVRGGDVLLLAGVRGTTAAWPARVLVAGAGLWRICLRPLEMKQMRERIERERGAESLLCSNRSR